MKMRKIVAVLMAVMMLCCIVPFAAMAESSSATIDFGDIANRVSYSTSQQVWAQNGITVTNDKGASTSNVGDYGGEGYPVRFYKSSTVTVEYVGMTQIVFNCDDYKTSYATDLAASISGADVSVDGTVVTVTLSAPADSFVIDQLAAQVRVDSITVYTGEAGETPEDPEVSEDPEADTELSIADAIALGTSKEHNTYTEDKYYVTGVITEIYNTQYGNMKLTDEAGNILTIYGTYDADGTNRFDAMETQPQVGDTVTVYGIVGQYNGVAQIKNGWIVDHVVGSETPEDPEVSEDPEADTELSIADAIALGTSKEHNTYTEGKYYVTGVITEIYNTQYGNMKLTDEAGNILTIYGTYDADGTNRFDAMETQPQVGDTVTVYGIVGQYNGVAQIKNGWIVDHVVGSETPEDPEVSEDPEADTELSIADAIALGTSKEHNTYTEGKYYVTGVITEIYNTQYGNMKLTDEAGNILTIYGTYDADGTNRFDAMETQPQVGDTVTVYGIVGQYNGTPQMKNAWIIAINPTDEPETPDEDDIDTTIPYLFGMMQENVSTEDVYFLAGGMAQTYYFATTTDPDAAILVWLEETDGGYYLYTMDGDSKLYINMVVSGTYVNGAYESAPSTVYNYDWELWTLVAEVNDDIYAFGTRNDRNYTTMGPVKVSYNGFHADLYYFSDEEECTHEYETVTIDAICGEDGATIYTCVLCGDYYEDVLPATGEHTYDDDYDADCNVCGDVREVSEEPVYVGGIATGTNTGAIGDQVSIQVQMDGNPGIVSAKVKVHFDHTVLKLVGFAAGEFSANGYSWGDVAAANEKGYFIINWCDATMPNNMSQLLATLTFEILEGAQVGEVYDIQPEFDCSADIFNAADETVWFYAVTGSVMVIEKEETVLGDADGNGKVNNRDLGRIQQFLNNYEVSIDESAVDMDGNGKINNRDLGMLQQLLNSGVN